MTVLWLNFDCEFFSRTSISEVFFGFFGPFYDQPRPILGDKTKFCQVKNRLVLVKRIAKERSMWAPVVMHKVHNAYYSPPDLQNTRFLRFFALFGAQKPNSGVEIFPKKKYFFF